MTHTERILAVLLKQNYYELWHTLHTYIPIKYLFLISSFKFSSVVCLDRNVSLHFPSTSYLTVSEKIHVRLITNILIILDQFDIKFVNTKQGNFFNFFFFILLQTVTWTNSELGMLWSFDLNSDKSELSTTLPTLPTTSYCFETFDLEVWF